MPIPPSETHAVSSDQCREHAVSFINELTKSFVKGTLRRLMRAVQADCGALFLFDPVQGFLVLDSVQSGPASGAASRRWSARKTALSLPLFAEGELFGLIKVGTRQDGSHFSQEDMGFANALCGHICRIVEDQIAFAKKRGSLDRALREKAVLEKYCTVGKLAAGIVGEINSPLDGAMRYSGLMLAHLSGTGRQQEYLNEVRLGLERIADITASLSRMGNPVPARPVDLPAIDIHLLLDESLETFGVSFEKSVRLKTNYQGPVRVRMDRNIRHVFINIIKNALDAMPAGGDLEISSEVKQAGLQIVFRDNGCGIPAEYQERIFEPFYTTKPKGAGSGLGLALCREIVAQCGGRIGVSSAPGKGTTFTILFPKGVLA
jgi:signal transduction histidine kinase